MRKEHHDEPMPESTAPDISGDFVTRAELKEALAALSKPSNMDISSPSHISRVEHEEMERKWSFIDLFTKAFIALLSDGNPPTSEVTIATAARAAEKALAFLDEKFPKPSAPVVTPDVPAADQGAENPAPEIS